MKLVELSVSNHIVFNSQHHFVTWYSEYVVFGSRIVEARTWYNGIPCSQKIKQNTLRANPRLRFGPVPPKKTETLATLFSIGQARLPLIYSYYSSPSILLMLLTRSLPLALPPLRTP